MMICRNCGIDCSHIHNFGSISPFDGKIVCKHCYRGEIMKVLDNFSRDDWKKVEEVVTKKKKLRFDRLTRKEIIDMFVEGDLHIFDFIEYDESGES